MSYRQAHKGKINEQTCRHKYKLCIVQQQTKSILMINDLVTWKKNNYYMSINEDSSFPCNSLGWVQFTMKSNPIDHFGQPLLPDTVITRVLPICDGSFDVL